jgi:uncharacterized membrane protein
LFAIGGLLLAAIIHIAVVLLVPLFATRDAWAMVKQLGPDRAFHTLPLPVAGTETFPLLDPKILEAVCAFSLSDGPIRVRATLPDVFWSIAVYDRRGRNIYSITDRAADRSELDLVVITPLQMTQLRTNPPASLDTAIVVEQRIEQGFAMLRVFVGDPSRLPEATAALKNADCAGAL